MCFAPGAGLLQDQIHPPATGLMGPLKFPDIGLPGCLQSQASGDILAHGKPRTLHQPIPRGIVAFRKFQGGPLRDVNVIHRWRKHTLGRVSVLQFLERDHVGAGLFQVMPDCLVVSGFPWPAALIVIGRQVLDIPGDQGKGPVRGNSRDGRQHQHYRDKQPTCCCYQNIHRDTVQDPPVWCMLVQEP